MGRAQESVHNMSQSFFIIIRMQLPGGGKREASQISLAQLCWISTLRMSAGLLPFFLLPVDFFTHLPIFIPHLKDWVPRTVIAFYFLFFSPVFFPFFLGFQFARLWRVLAEQGHGSCIHSAYSAALVFFRKLDILD